MTTVIDNNLQLNDWLIGVRLCHMFKMMGKRKLRFFSKNAQHFAPLLKLIIND